MCLAIPGQIVEMLDGDRHYAVVNVCGVRRKINIDLLKMNISFLEIGCLFMWDLR